MVKSTNSKMTVDNSQVTVDKNSEWDRSILNF